MLTFQIISLFSRVPQSVFANIFSFEMFILSQIIDKKIKVVFSLHTKYKAYQYYS